MKIKGVDAKVVLDSRKDKTILVSINTDVGNFSASSPSGKSKGKYEKKSYKKDLKGDIQTIKKFSDYFSEEALEKFDDLRRIEDIMEGHVGGNTMFAFESAILKAMAKEQKKEVWELVDASYSGKERTFPRLVGNCVGGGKHSSLERKPDFQEFLLVPKAKSVKESWEANKKAKEKIEFDIDQDFIAAYTGIIQLPRSSKFGVYLAYRYYKNLFLKLKNLQPHELFEARIRIGNLRKLSLIPSTYYLSIMNQRSYNY